MAENCRLIECDAEMQQAVPDFINFKEQFRGIPGHERLECEGMLSSFMLVFWLVYSFRQVHQRCRMSHTHMSVGCTEVNFEERGWHKLALGYIVSCMVRHLVRQAYHHADS